MKRMLSTTFIIVLLTAILGFSVGIGAGPPPPPVETVEGDTVVLTASEEYQKATDEWQTLKKRQAAEPLPFPMETSATISEEFGEEVTGEPGFAPGVLFNPKADKEAKKSFRDAWKYDKFGVDSEFVMEDDSAQDFVDYGTAGVYTSYLTNKYWTLRNVYPQKSVGKLYIDGGGYCSASVISPNNIIVTAAHCVFDYGVGWKGGWTFVPKDFRGIAPYGTFRWSSARILPDYISSGARRYDLAVITLQNNSAGRPVTYYTGALGRAWDWGYTQHLHAQGYPSEMTSGKYTWTCAAETFSYSTDVMGMGCNMMFGSSGGPWIMKYQPNQYGGVNYVNAVVSGGVSGPTWGNTFYGPRFSSSNIVPLCTSEGC